MSDNSDHLTHQQAHHYLTNANKKLEIIGSFSSLAGRELYLEMRSQLILQTEVFMNDYPVGLTIENFKKWLNVYPFIRS